MYESEGDSDRGNAIGSRAGETEGLPICPPFTRDDVPDCRSGRKKPRICLRLKSSDEVLLMRRWWKSWLKSASRRTSGTFATSCGGVSLPLPSCSNV